MRVSGLAIGLIGCFLVLPLAAVLGLFALIIALTGIVGTAVVFADRRRGALPPPTAGGPRPRSSGGHLPSFDDD